MNNDHQLALDEDLPGDLWASTVRLTIDHGFGGTPLWYETMVFPTGSYSDIACERYETEEEARAGHARIVASILDGTFQGY